MQIRQRVDGRERPEAFVTGREAQADPSEPICVRDSGNDARNRPGDATIAAFVVVVVGGGGGRAGRGAGARGGAGRDWRGGIGGGEDRPGGGGEGSGKEGRYCKAVKGVGDAVQERDGALRTRSIQKLDI